MDKRHLEFLENTMNTAMTVLVGAAVAVEAAVVVGFFGSLGYITLAALGGN